MPSEKSCGAVIFKQSAERKYLLLHYEGGHWDFVKGHVEGNETEKETVLRETREEVGNTELSFIDGFRHRISYYYRRAGQTVFKEVVFYLLETKIDAVRLSREHVGYDWLSYDRAYERLTYKNAKETIRRARDYLDTLEQRKLSGAA
ncbi:MAG TPA: NUDIX domain-containing protein [Candidatus Dormibacteraeota bacterium]|nr:NUDIX domain-containing protein [Candidatus Dormibacteraeota bacterium]